MRGCQDKSQPNQSLRTCCELMETTTMTLPLRCELSRWDDSLLRETRIGCAMLNFWLQHNFTARTPFRDWAYSLGLRGRTMPLLQLRGKFSNPRHPSWLQSSLSLKSWCNLAENYGSLGATSLPTCILMPSLTSEHISQHFRPWNEVEVHDFKMQCCNISRSPTGLT